MRDLLSQVCNNLQTSWPRHLGKHSCVAAVDLRTRAGLELLQFEAASLEPPRGYYAVDSTRF